MMSDQENMTLDCAKHGPGPPACRPLAKGDMFCRTCWDEAVAKYIAKRDAGDFPPIPAPVSMGTKEDDS